jgi:uncharacterized SAM-binding protein YcdF (DUF218 family)
MNTRGWRVVGLGVATAGLTGILLLARDATARRLVVTDAVQPSDAIVVMAGDPDYERTGTAARLMRSEVAPILILTGGEPGPGDSAESLRARAIAFGVAPERIRIETVSHSTREAVVAVAPLLAAMGARTVTLVTSPYHQRRAAGAARRAWPGVQVRSWPASPSSWTAEGWAFSSRGRRVVVTEYAKLLYYRCRGWI